MDTKHFFLRMMAYLILFILKTIQNVFNHTAVGKILDIASKFRPLNFFVSSIQRSRDKEASSRLTIKPNYP